MKPKSFGPPIRALILIAILTFTYLSLQVIPNAYAWNVSANPSNQTSAPGSSVTYTVSVSYDPGERQDIFIPIQLLVSPAVTGLTITFSPEQGYVSFTSTMTVKVDNSIAPGPYVLHVLAHWAGTGFPNANDKELLVGLVVFSVAVVKGVVHVSVPQMEKGSLGVGEPVRIEYYTDPGDDGTVGLHITKPPLLMIYWQNGPSPIVGGLLYDVTAPGMNQPGDYTVTASVTLKDGSTIAGTTTFKVGETATAAVDFSISLSPAVLTLAKGSSGAATLTVSERHPNKATWPLNLNVEGPPPGVSITFAPNPVEPPAGGQTTSRVLVRVSDNAMPGNYSLDITAVGGVCAPETPGGQSICIDFMPKHTTLVLIIQSSTPGQFGSLDPLLSALRTFWIEIAVGSLVVLLVGAALLARRRKKPSLTLRFCIECGVKMKTAEAYCPKCGAKQPTRT